jgi:hypothetical protein
MSLAEIAWWDFKKNSDNCVRLLFLSEIIIIILLHIYI